MYKEIIRHNKEEQNMQLQVLGREYPKFGFLCPSCGSPDVLVTWQTKTPPLTGNCLDCNNVWLISKIMKMRS